MVNELKNLIKSVGKNALISPQHRGKGNRRRQRCSRTSFMWWWECGAGRRLASVTDRHSYARLPMAATFIPGRVTTRRRGDSLPGPATSHAGEEPHAATTHDTRVFFQVSYLPERCSVTLNVRTTRNIFCAIIVALTQPCD